MKGLLVKDFQLLQTNKMTFPIFIIIALVFLISGDQEAGFFVVPYITMIFGIMTVSTVSYDEVDHSIAYIMTLPVTRKIYVVEKYVLMLLGTIIGWAISFSAASVFAVVRAYELDWVQWIVTTLVIMVVMFMFLCVMLPVQLKFGATNSRIVLIVIFAIIAIGILGIKNLVPVGYVDSAHMTIVLNRIINSVTIVGVCGIFLVIAAVFSLLSMKISMGIMKQKQF